MTDTEMQTARAKFTEQMESLDCANCVEVARALLYAAEGIRQQGKAAFEPAVEFLATLSAAMNSKALQRAEAEGLTPQRTQAELEAIVDKQERHHLN